MEIDSGKLLEYDKLKEHHCNGSSSINKSSSFSTFCTDRNSYDNSSSLNHIIQAADGNCNEIDVPPFEISKGIR